MSGLERVHIYPENLDDMICAARGLHACFSGVAVRLCGAIRLLGDLHVYIILHLCFPKCRILPTGRDSVVLRKNGVADSSHAGYLHWVLHSDTDRLAVHVGVLLDPFHYM